MLYKLSAQHLAPHPLAQGLHHNAHLPNRATKEPKPEDPKPKEHPTLQI